MSLEILGSRMEAEIGSQPECWARAAALPERAKLPRAGERVAVVGCGTSWFMAQSYADRRERAGLGPTDAYAASEASLSDRGYDRVVAISRSGTTTEILELVASVRRDTPVVGITGVADSPLVELAHEVVALSFADEASVVQTRFATTALAVLRASLGERLDDAIRDAETAAVEPLPGLLLTADQYTLLGAGWTIGLAHEGALKLREAAQLWTESYPAMEYRHGPISIAAPGRVVWMLGPPPAGLTDDVARTGAQLVAGVLDPMAELIRVQRVALHRSRAAGVDADSPRNLTRSVILG